MWNYAYTVPENKKVRVIVHTDCKNAVWRVAASGLSCKYKATPRGTVKD